MLDITGGVPRHTADQSELTLADIAEKLMTEFGAQFNVSTISNVVLACRHDLQKSPAGAPPKQVERLARYRLSHALTE
jgi:hypothetical protein